MFLSLFLLLQKNVQIYKSQKLTTKTWLTKRWESLSKSQIWKSSWILYQKEFGGLTKNDGKKKFLRQNCSVAKQKFSILGHNFILFIFYFFEDIFVTSKVRKKMLWDKVYSLTQFAVLEHKIVILCQKVIFFLHLFWQSCNEFSW